MFQNVYAATAAEPSVASSLPMFLIMGVFLLFFYVATIRPRQKKEQQQRKMIAGLNVGDEVITYGGMMGKVAKVKDNFLVMNIADNVEIKMQKSYISHVLPKGTLKGI